MADKKPYSVEEDIEDFDKKHKAMQERAKAKRSKSKKKAAPKEQSWLDKLRGKVRKYMKGDKKKNSSSRNSSKKKTSAGGY